MTKTQKPKLKEGVIYGADNGERICKHCAGMTALYTGRDRSGTRCRPFTPADAIEWRKMTGKPLTCERGCTSYPDPVTPHTVTLARPHLALQMTGGKPISVVDIREGQRLWEAYRDTHGLGASAAPAIAVIDTQTGQTVAKISYNGRAWDTAGKEIL